MNVCVFVLHTNIISTHLTEMEKSPGELWHPRITKSPTSLCLRSSSAELRLAFSWNHLHTHTHTHTEDMMLSLIWCKPHTHTYSPSHITAYCTSFILNKFVFLVHKHKKDEPRVKSVCCWTLFHHSHIPGLYYQKVRNHLIKYMFSLILMLIY